jgi:hypothetical protein
VAGVLDKIRQALEASQIEERPMAALLQFLAQHVHPVFPCRRGRNLFCE